jgi:pimeloyl-ACP methyl ester carboxylesterase
MRTSVNGGINRFDSTRGLRLKSIPFKRRRIIQIVGILAILFIVAVYVGLPTAMAVTAITPDRTVIGEPPDGFSDIELVTDDNVRLAAWYAEPQNGAVLILLHGAGGGRDTVRAYATMLRTNGFGVLALNLRGYGDSEGRINRLGWNGTQDIGAAVDFLSQLDGVDAIGGLGLSMGGEVLLGAASNYPVIKAIVADGATFRAVNEYTALSMNRPLYRNFTHHIFSFMVGLLTGDGQPQPPLLESIEQAETTTFLFIAAGNDDTEVHFNQFYHEAVQDRSSLWVIPGVGHTGGFNHDSREYERRVVDFFSQMVRVP